MKNVCEREGVRGGRERGEGRSECEVTVLMCGVLTLYWAELPPENHQPPWWPWNTGSPRVSFTC